MDSKNGGFSSSDKQREAAAEIARRKVLQAYEDKEVKTATEFIKKQEKEEKAGATSANRVLGKSTTPVLRQVSNEEWKKYHTAWQDYYQKYYSEYYMNAAKEYVARQQVKEIRKKAEETAVEPKKNEEKVPKLSEVAPSENPSDASALASHEEQGPKGLKARIRARAVERAKASRRRMLTPVLAGVAVVLTILFLQYNRLIFAPIAAYVSPGDMPADELSAVDPNVQLTKVSSENVLFIPKLNVQVPIRFGVELNDVMAAMNDGVVHYRINGASAFPGEIGNFVITGHSAGDIYSSNQYKFIFSGLERLEEGDLLYVHYNSTRYTYRMTRNEIIEPTEVSKLIYDTDKPVMTLITCWPLGTSRYRLLVTAEQISPSYDNAVVATEVEEATPEEEIEMPKNEETFFERIKRALGW